MLNVHKDFSYLCLREFLFYLSFRIILTECEHMRNTIQINLHFSLFSCVTFFKLTVDQATSANQRSQAPPPEAFQGLLVVLCGHGFCCRRIR